MPPSESGKISGRPKPVPMIFYADYDYAWDSALKEMQRYNLKTVNKEVGSIITDEMREYEGRQERNEYRYHIEVALTVLPKEEELPQTQVVITKYVSQYRGLDTDRLVASDLVEEKVILHRIQRLLEIERTKLQKAAEK